MAGLTFFRCSRENMQNILISLMDENLYFVHTRNYKQETIYCTQETKTIFEKFFPLINNRFSHFYEKKTNYLREKKQIRLTSNVSRANNK